MRRESLLIATYVLAVTVTTAISGALGPLASVIDSFFGIGLVIVVRNQLHDLWEPEAMRWLLLLLLVAMGTIGSLAANAAHPRVALASGIAFFAANIAAMISWPRSRRMSIVLFAVTDSLLFPPNAIGTFVAWVVAGQIVAKIAGAAAWTILFRAASSRRSANRPSS